MLFLSRADVRALLDLDELIDALAAAFAELEDGAASVPPRVAAQAPAGLLIAMPGYVGGVLASKLVTVFPGNREAPSHQALVALFDGADGTPLAVMDGAEITAVRTAAASALSARLLARPDAGVLAVLGAGVQARSHLAALRRVRSFRQIRVASRSAERARALADEAGATFAGSFEEAVRGADVVCACTDAAEPVVRGAWLQPGAHVTSVGFAGAELDAETISAGLLAVESRTAFAAPPAGAHELQGLDPASAVTLGELVAGTRPGRTADDQVTIYKSVGHAAEDAVAARLVHERALAAGAGTDLALDG